MNICACSSYEDLNGLPAVRNRGHNTGKIIKSLEFIVKHDDNEHQLYKCSHCEQHWQSCWWQGNKPYIYKVPDIGVTDWLEKPFINLCTIFGRIEKIQEYLKGPKFEEQTALCRFPGCEEHSIRLSVLCLFHHMENIGIKITMPDDYRWFGPYVKSDYDFDMNQLKSIANYKPL